MRFPHSLPINRGEALPGMNALTYINPNAAVEFDRADFLAADIAERRERKASAAAEVIQAQRELQDATQAFIASREPECEDDYAEADLRVGDCIHLAVVLRAVCEAVEPTFTKLQRADVATAEPRFLEQLADSFTERLSEEAARVFRAAIAAGVM